MPLIGHLYLIWISPFESTWCTSDFHTIYSRLFFVDFFYLNIYFWFLMHRPNWNWQLLGIVLNHFGWLLVVLGGWKEKKIELNKKKIWFKSNESWFCWFKKEKIANPGQLQVIIFMTAMLLSFLWPNIGKQK